MSISPEWTIVGLLVLMFVSFYGMMEKIERRLETIEQLLTMDEDHDPS